MIRRVLVVGYATTAYLLFLITFAYTIGFLAGRVVPKDVDDGVMGPPWQAVLIDGLLLTLFAVQHSVMARPWFKRWWTRLVPPAVERSTYVLLASFVVVLLLWQWRPLPAVVWSVDVGWVRAGLWGLNLFGWVVVVASTFLLGHFDLFGMRQALARARARGYAEPEFRQPLLYRLVRHPLMVGFLIAFWFAPDMSAGRLLFAAATSGYILVGVRLEEHDLGQRLGEGYRQYLADVPRFVPRLSGRPGQRVTAGDRPSH
jgi:protein-S-isoprenylcysteine O-methyltransferase Ste14